MDPPVIDVERQLRMEGERTSPLSTIIPVVAFAFFIFFLYKRYRDKRLTERAHTL